jgi:hypothetical protein
MSRRRGLAGRLTPTQSAWLHNNAAILLICKDHCSGTRHQLRLGCVQACLEREAQRARLAQEDTHG